MIFFQDPSEQAEQAPGIVPVGGEPEEGDLADGLEAESVVGGVHEAASGGAVSALPGEEAGGDVGVFAEPDATCEGVGTEGVLPEGVPVRGGEPVDGGRPEAGEVGSGNGADDCAEQLTQVEVLEVQAGRVEEAIHQGPRVGGGRDGEPVAVQGQEGQQGEDYRAAKPVECVHAQEPEGGCLRSG